MDEASLILRARSGDQDAFRQLVEAYAELTQRTARVFLTDRAMAEDAVQEAWLDAWRALPRFQLGRPFRPWLLTLVANRCRMSIRARKPAAVLLHDGYVDGPSSEDVLSGVLRAESDADLRAVLAGLQAEQQRILALRFFAGLQLEEIADLTGTPLGTVKSRMHRALQTLRLQLGNDAQLEKSRQPIGGDL